MACWACALEKHGCSFAGRKVTGQATYISYDMETGERRFWIGTEDVTETVTVHGGAREVVPRQRRKEKVADTDDSEEEAEESTSSTPASEREAITAQDIENGEKEWSPSILGRLGKGARRSINVRLPGLYVVSLICQIEHPRHSR